MQISSSNSSVPGQQTNCISTWSTLWIYPYGLPNTTEVVFSEDNLLRLHTGQLEKELKGVIDRVKKLDEKLKSQEKVIEKLREMLYQQGDKIEDQERKIEGQERKIKGQERKIKGYVYCVRKKYNTRSGKN